ncbi:nucleotide sugar dehydrogenase [Xylariaceae sp. FL0016]|nr:nucleotide sugar dehydrogenase [Xylariaceae sp. FL0016]
MSIPIPVPVVDSHDRTCHHDVASTAPTTPDGSFSFSPVLQARPGQRGNNVEYVTRMLDGSSITSEDSDTGSFEALTDFLHPVRNICFVGAGYVGGPTAAMIAYHNPQLRVNVADKDAGRIRRWNSKHLPIYEPGLLEIVRVARDGCRQLIPASTLRESDSQTSVILAGDSLQAVQDQMDGGHVSTRQPNLFFSDDVQSCIEEADIVFIAVNTPTKLRGAGAGSATDMTTFEAATAEVAKHTRPGAIIVEKSTVPCRTADFVRETLAMHRPEVRFEVLSNPEFLAAGTAVKDLLHPDRILIGSSPTTLGHRAAAALGEVYAAWVPRSRIITTNVWSSELAKLVANSMLAQRISSINSISAICERTGAEIDEIATSVGCDPRIGDKFLKAGIGFGGSCFKKDLLSLVYLAESLGLEQVGEYWRQVVKMNDYQRDRFSQRVIRCLNNTLVGKKITLLGYAFKANTSDTRESPALEIVKTLMEEGPREIAIYDSCCNPALIAMDIKQIFRDCAASREDGGPIVVYSNAYEACVRTDAVLITTESDEFRNKRPKSSSHAASGTMNLANSSGSKPPRKASQETEKLVQTAGQTTTGRVPSTTDGDVMQLHQPQPLCAADCPDCELMEAADHAVTDSLKESRVKERLDWSKISHCMKEPKWLFDGKGIIDPEEMARFCIRVESVGRQGRSS